MRSNVTAHAAVIYERPPHDFIYLKQWAGPDGKLIEYTRKGDKLIAKLPGCGELANLIKKDFRLAGAYCSGSEPRPGRPGRACAAGVLGTMCLNVHACVPPFIGHLLDTETSKPHKYLILLALPRGLEPLFSP